MRVGCIGCLMLPSLLMIIIPIALCIAVIFTYNRLTGDSELIVLHAVGVSKIQLAKPVLTMGVICALVCYALSLYLIDALALIDPNSPTYAADVMTLWPDEKPDKKKHKRH